MSIHPVDMHVGEKLRQRRIYMGMTQSELGEAVGVTFQQIQKYEKGLNRIGSSRLYEFANVLNISIIFFFEDLNEENINSLNNKVAEDSSSYEYNVTSNKEVLGLIKAYNTIKEPNVRRRILSLVKSISDTYNDNITKDLDVLNSDLEEKEYSL